MVDYLSLKMCDFKTRIFWSNNSQNKLKMNFCSLVLYKQVDVHCQIELHTTVFAAVVWGDVTRMHCTARKGLSLRQGQRTDEVLKQAFLFCNISAWDFFLPFGHLLSVHALTS